MAGYYSLLYMERAFIAKVWLLVSSLFFYSYWNVKYLALILASIIVNFLLSESLLKDKSPNTKKIKFIIGLSFNLGLLCYFKYADFFISNLNTALGSDFNLLKIILPLGISFFTLQQVAFIVDTYQGVSKEKSFLDYSLFVSFFPQLIAGPIVHYGDLIPQFKSEENKKIIPYNICLGIFIFTLGLFKKVILADTFSDFASPGFDNGETLHFFSAWGTSLSYAFQLYFDFSGYSDMAIGIGYLFNIKLPHNFKSPLRSVSVVDFWSRWHITLTNFITSYVFTPLVRVMPRMSFGYMMLSMFIAMTLAGVWHGAGWTFILYGVMHGSAIVINHLWKKRKRKLPVFLAWLLTFNFINIAFIVFRAKTLDRALEIIYSMFGGASLVLPKGIIGTDTLEQMGLNVGHYMTNTNNLNLLMIIFGFVLIKKAKNSMEYVENFIPTTKFAVIASCLFVFSLFGMNRVSEFIYFNF